jgi:hypothetical protein
MIQLLMRIKEKSCYSNAKALSAFVMGQVIPACGTWLSSNTLREVAQDTINGTIGVDYRNEVMR